MFHPSRAAESLKEGGNHTSISGICQANGTFFPPLITAWLKSLKSHYILVIVGFYAACI